MQSGAPPVGAGNLWLAPGSTIWAVSDVTADSGATRTHEVVAEMTAGSVLIHTGAAAHPRQVPTGRTHPGRQR